MGPGELAGYLPLLFVGSFTFRLSKPLAGSGHWWRLYCLRKPSRRFNYRTIFLLWSRRVFWILQGWQCLCNGSCRLAALSWFLELGWLKFILECLSYDQRRLGKCSSNVSRRIVPLPWVLACQDPCEVGSQDLVPSPLLLSFCSSSAFLRAQHHPGHYKAEFVHLACKAVSAQI